MPRLYNLYANMHGINAVSPSLVPRSFREDLYLIESAGIDSLALGAHLGIDESRSPIPVIRWMIRGDRPGPSTISQVGELAAVMSFMQEELSFKDKEAGDFLQTCHIDPETNQPFTMLKQLKTGNIPYVVQEAIRFSVETSEK